MASLSIQNLVGTSFPQRQNIFLKHHSISHFATKACCTLWARKLPEYFTDPVRPPLQRVIPRFGTAITQSGPGNPFQLLSKGRIAAANSRPGIFVHSTFGYR